MFHRMLQPAVSHDNAQAITYQPPEHLPLAHFPLHCSVRVGVLSRVSRIGVRAGSVEYVVRGDIREGNCPGGTVLQS